MDEMVWQGLPRMQFHELEIKKQITDKFTFQSLSGTSEAGRSENKLPSHLKGEWRMFQNQTLAQQIAKSS